MGFCLLEKIGFFGPFADGPYLKRELLE